MAETAYELARFEPRQNPAPAPRVRVVKTPVRKPRRQTFRLLRMVLLCAMVMVLVGGVLRTQAKMTEIQGTIVRTENQLSEQKALSAYLGSQLGEMVNLRNIEARAAELGLVRMDASRINHVRVSEDAGIVVRQGGLAALWQNLRAGFMNILGAGE